MQAVHAPSQVGHRLTAAASSVATGPRWTCSCGHVFTDPQPAARHTVTVVRPRRAR